MSDIEIRPATSNDASIVLDFIIELAVYENAKAEVKTNLAEIKQTLFGEHASARALICSLSGKPVGYAVYFFNYSTWLGRNGIYLEDVYVTPEARGKGAGKALMKYIARQAVSNHCGRFEWSVLDWNQPALDFYHSLGARPQSEWITYRLSGPALESFADSSV